MYCCMDRGDLQAIFRVNETSSRPRVQFIYQPNLLIYQFIFI